MARVSFQSALTKFRAHLTGTELVDFRQTTYDQLCQEIIRLQHDQENRKAMMNLSRIQSFLEAMENFGKVVEVFLNVSDVVAFVWGPIKFLLLAASNWTDSFETLLEAYENIGEQLPLLADYEELFHDNPKMLGALEHMYIDILDFHHHALQFFKGKVWRKLFKALWKDFRSKFEGILKSLRRHKELIENRAALAQYTIYQEDIQKLKAEIEELVLEERNTKLRRVQEWLATKSEAQINHERFVAERNKYPGTGRWILKHGPISSWMTADVPTTCLLWMIGVPGAGKTMLASVVIEECKRQKDSITSYFYCSQDSQDDNYAVAVFRSLLEQILHQCPILLAYCHSKLITSGEPSLRSFTLTKALLTDCCIRAGKQYIVIDGLDECEPVQRKLIVDFFNGLVNEQNADEPGKLRVLFVSQEYAEMKRALRRPTDSQLMPGLVKLGEGDNLTDIETYANVWSSKIKDKFELDSVEEMELRMNIVTRAKGMFLYAKLVLENLYNQVNRENLKDEVDTLPDGIRKAYERIIARIRNNSSAPEWQCAKKLLGWMVCAKRMLTLREVHIALALDFDSQEVLYDERKLRVHIQDICSSLVSVSGDRVRLVHSTARVYIPSSTAEIHWPSVECELAAICLQYLTFPCFRDNSDADKEELREWALTGALGFQDYAIAKWFHHVLAFIAAGADLIKRRDKDALSNSRNNTNDLLRELTDALDDFSNTYGDEWGETTTEHCKDKCKAFVNEELYDHLLPIAQHIYTFQLDKHRQNVSIKGLAVALERNRALLEELPSKLDSSALAIYRQFYDDERRYKCNRITCIYFSEGFRDAKSRRHHLNMHDRPFRCEFLGCPGAEMGFWGNKELEKHNRSMHPETVDLSQTFKASGPSRTQTQFSCQYCQKCFTRKMHKVDHEKSHRGEKPCVCPECGRGFTRVNDMKRHRRTKHERR